LADQYPGLFRKDGASTIVDLDLLDRIIASLPFKAPANNSAA
jgi:hypothetical protein